MMRARRLRRLPAIVPLALAACGNPSADGGYFPLAAGHEWRYEITTARDNAEAEHDVLSLRALGSDALAGAPAWHRLSDSGTSWWLRSDESGIYRVASQSAVDAEPKPDAHPRYVLRQPYRAGTQWRATTTAYLLERPMERPRDVGIGHRDIPMTYTIEAVGDTVEVPAGRFEGCLRVQGEAELRLYADAVAGWRNTPLRQTEWYCPPAGLVKLERHEPSPSAVVVGGRYTMALAQWR